MTPLQQRMIEDLPLRGLSERTQEMYVRAVRQLAEHDHTSPARITEEELRDSFLSLKNVKHSSRSASTIALCGITFFYEHTRKREWPTLTFVRAPRAQKLPVLLRVAEVRTILVHVQLPRYRVCLSPIDACGLRLQEGTHLQVPDIDSARMLVHVRRGKGAKDRSAPLPPRTLEFLRQYWKTHRIEKLADGHVTCRFQESTRHQWHRRTLPARACLQRFLQHVLPKGFITVRDYGFLRPTCRNVLTHIRPLLATAACHLLAPHDEKNQPLTIHLPRRHRHDSAPHVGDNSSSSIISRAPQEPHHDPVPPRGTCGR